jgi:hypothetical protein
MRPCRITGTCAGHCCCGSSFGHCKATRHKYRTVYVIVTTPSYAVRSCPSAHKTFSYSVAYLLPRSIVPGDVLLFHSFMAARRER